MLTACSSQQFCDFADNAPIIGLAVPSGVASPDGWGTVLMPVSFYEEDGAPRDVIVAAGGPPSQTETIQLANDGELSVVTNTFLSTLCTREDRETNENSICWERHAGAALAFRSNWDTGQACVAIGFAGHELQGGLGFWCATGTNHLRELSLLEHTILHESTQAMTHVLEPVERMFVGTNRALYLLDGDSVALRHVQWDSEGDMPTDENSVEALSAMESDDGDDFEHLVAVGVPYRHAVLIGEVSSPETGEDDATLRPMACITGDEPDFGGVVLVTRLEPGGDPMLLVSARRGVEDRVDAVHIFELELAADPSDVECLSTPVMSLRCMEDADLAGADYSCDVNSANQLNFGAAFDVGNIDDTPEYEVVVGAPGATSDGFGQAGVAFVYRPVTDDTSPLVVLADSGEERQAAFLGAGVSLAPVGNRDEPILAAPGEESLLMFLCTGVGESPPEWDSPLDRGESLVDSRCRSDLQ